MKEKPKGYVYLLLVLALTIMTACIMSGCNTMREVDEFTEETTTDIITVESTDAYGEPETSEIEIQFTAGRMPD